MKKFILSILALVVSTTAFGGTIAQVNALQAAMNKFDPGSAALLQYGNVLVKQREWSVKCVYNYAVSGGAVGTINLKDENGKNCVLPQGAIIRDVLIDVRTDPTSGGAATIAIGSGAAANDLKAATAIASYTGLVAGVPVGSAATAIRLSANQSPYITVATAALTAGKLNVHIKYQLSE